MALCDLIVVEFYRTLGARVKRWFRDIDIHIQIEAPNKTCIHMA